MVDRLAKFGLTINLDFKMIFKIRDIFPSKLTYLKKMWDVKPQASTRIGGKIIFFSY